MKCDRRGKGIETRSDNELIQKQVDQALFITGGTIEASSLNGSVKINPPPVLYTRPNTRTCSRCDKEFHPGDEVFIVRMDLKKSADDGHKIEVFEQALCNICASQIVYVMGRNSYSR